MTSPYFLQVPLIKDTRAQVPKATCALVSTNVQRNVIGSAPPFDKPELRRAVFPSMAFIDTLTQGAGQVGGALLAPPEGIWGMPEDLMRQLPGYDPDVAKSRNEAAPSWPS